MCSWVSAAAVAVDCELVISCVSCSWVCFWVCPAGQISPSGTTAWCGFSQATRAVKMLNLLPVQPW
jgi:Fe-S-cluster-containing hydrogenase component 2